jgi:hypothetical protein
MIFSIQLSVVKYIDSPSREYQDMEEALYHVVSEHSENAYLSWNHVPVQVSYKYDVFVMVPDVLKMMEAISTNRAGELCINWCSDTFSSRWDMKWAGSSIYVRSDWGSVVGELAHHLNQRRELTISCGSFLGEWASLLERLLKVIDDTQAIILDNRDTERARALLQHIAERGSLYAKPLAT